MSSPGQRVPVAVPPPGPEKAAVVGMQPLVPINAAAVSRDGRYIAVGLDDRTVVLWDTAAGRPVRTLAGHQKAVLSVAFSPDGKHLAVRLRRRAPPILWDVETGEPAADLQGPHRAGRVGRVQPRRRRGSSPARPTGRRSSGTRGTGEQVHKLKSKGDPGRRVQPGRHHPGHGVGGPHRDAVGRRDRQAERSCCGATGRTSTASPSARTAGASSPGRPTTLGIIWDAATGKRIIRTGRHTQQRPLGRVHPRRPAGHHRRARGTRHDVGRGHRGARPRRSSATAAEILSIVPSPDGRTMLTGSRDGTARLWDLATGRELLDADDRRHPQDVGRRQPRRPVRRLGSGPPRARLPLHEAAAAARSISSSPRATAPGCWPRCGGASGRSRRSRWAGASRRSSSSSRRRTAFRPTPTATLAADVTDQGGGDRRLRGREQRRPPRRPDEVRAGRRAARRRG